MTFYLTFYDIRRLSGVNHLTDGTQVMVPHLSDNLLFIPSAKAQQQASLLTGSRKCAALAMQRRLKTYK